MYVYVHELNVHELNQGSTALAHRPNLAHNSVLYDVKFYWDTAAPFCFCVISCDFPTTTAELGSYNRNHMICKP